jgi:hypothetical protein
LIIYFIFVCIFSLAKKLGYICLQGFTDLFGSLVGDGLIDRVAAFDACAVRAYFANFE